LSNYQTDCVPEVPRPALIPYMPAEHMELG